MLYTVQYSKRAVKDIEKLDRQTRELILGWIRKNLEGCENPRLFGKGLTSNLSGKWRYRVGDYRIIAEIDGKNILITVIAVAHRSKAYKLNY